MSIEPTPSRGRRRAIRLLAGAGAVAVGIGATALPALAHASFSSSATFGFAPNVLGGTGLAGAAPPYAAGTTNTVYLRVPFEQTEQFNGSDDTNVSVEAIVPEGFTNAQCGPTRKSVKNETTSNTNQPGDLVSGWDCHVHEEDGNTVIHWTGPQVVAPVTAADSAQFFVFTITTPSPDAQTTYNGTLGTEGFIVDQEYASGEKMHWIPNAEFPGTAPVGSTTVVAGGLARTVSGAVFGSYTGLQPSRILDTRDSVGLAGPFGADQTRDLTVTNFGGVPANATSVVLNVTATSGTETSNLRVWPAGQPQPEVSNLNVGAGETIANLVKVRLGTDGKVSIRNQSGNVAVIADVVGYYGPTGSMYNGVQPARVLDTRDDVGLADPFAPAQTRDLSVIGVGGVPVGATAVAMNVTVTGGTDASNLRVWPAGQSQPNVSNLNWVAGQTIPNMVIAKVGTDGKVSIRNQSGNVQVIADVVGYYGSSGDLFAGLQPQRILDTRDDVGLADPFTPAQTRDLIVTDVGGVPADAMVVVLNVTVTGGTDAGNLRLWPAGQTQPEVSNLNWVAGQTIPNLVMVKVGAAGKVSIRNQSGNVQVIADVVGFFSAPVIVPPPPPPPAP